MRMCVIKMNRKDVFGFIMVAFNSLLLFVVSNFYIFDKVYSFKIPIVMIFGVIIILMFFPSLLTKKLYSSNLIKIRNGYRLLIMFLINVVFNIVFYLFSYYKYDINMKILIINLLILVFLLGSVFFNGMIRVYLFSKQLGIRYRFIGLILGMIPIFNLIMLIKMIKICMDEVNFENSKIIMNLQRKDKELCKTKYPLLLVHGIFFRDYKLLNYWGRIPDELIQNGATIYYGDHSSSLHVKNSAEELVQRVKQIVKETNCEKVNIIAHSKGGLDARYAIANLGLNKYVASLTMINTPNHGCVFADYLLNKMPKSFVDKVADGYNFSFKKLGDSNPDFIAGVTDLTSSVVGVLNKEMPNDNDVYYQTFGSVLKKAVGGRFPLNLTNNYVKLFDGKNDGLVGIDSFLLKDVDFHLIETPYERGISHGDMIDLNHENIKGFDVREFYVKVVNDLKERGF